jgi:hypothetical protein
LLFGSGGRTGTRSHSRACASRASVILSHSAHTVREQDGAVERPVAGSPRPSAGRTRRACACRRAAESCPRGTRQASTRTTAMRAMSRLVAGCRRRVPRSGRRPKSTSSRWAVRCAPAGRGGEAKYNPVGPRTHPPQRTGAGTAFFRKSWDMYAGLNTFTAARSTFKATHSHVIEVTGPRFFRLRRARPLTH